MNDLAKRIAALPPDKRALLERKLHEKREVERRRIQPQPRDGQPFPLSFEQERMWFIHRWEPDSPLYNGTLLIHLLGGLDVGLLARSINVIIQRHESLRSTFPLLDLQPAQLIAPALDAPLPIVDLCDWPQAEREPEFYKRALAQLKRPFDLERGPLLRTTLFKLADDQAVLLVSMHHIVHDGWSLGVFTRELGQIYTALSSGAAPPLPDLHIQYADFAVWQRTYLQGDTLDALLHYWKKQLADIPQTLNLPTDRPRPAVQTSNGARLEFKIEKPLCDALGSFSRQAGATLFMTLLSAFGVLLERFSGQSDVVVGVPIVNRGQPELTSLIGVFVNTLALRLDLSGNPAFSELLERVRRTTLAAFAHQSMPFARLVAELQTQRSLGHAPIFQVSFGMQEAPLKPVELPGLSLDLLETRHLTLGQELPPLHNGMALFDLTFHLSEIPQGVGGWIEYNSDLFNQQTIARWAGHYLCLLESIVATPAQRISALPLLNAAERRQILVEWNQTQVCHTLDTCVHTLFEAQAQRTPASTALVFQDKTLDYATLNQRANCLAHYMRGLGVGPETLVSICVERSIEMVVAVLAVLKAGGAYVPLDPALPKERLAFILQDTQAPLVLTQQHLLERLPAHPAIFCLDNDWVRLKSFGQENPANQTGPDNLAYVIYTSGSTGRPKGVMLVHKGLLNLTAAQRAIFDIHSHSQVLQFASFSFDASVSEIFTALLNGATLHLATSDELTPGPPLTQLLRERAISVLTLPPSALALLPADDLPALKTLVSAGEACPAELAAKWGQGRRFINAYGPTESTVCVSCAPLANSAETQPPIGRPIDNLRVYVLDANLRPAPPGVPGELLVGGIGLARGYVGRPALTAANFIPDPFGEQAGARLYRTGDWVRYRPDGNLEFLGRIDQQVKLRGFRIELGEIESALTQHPQVREAAAVVRQDAAGQQLLAFCTAMSGAAPTLSDLRAFLQARLPDYMLPSAFVVLDAMPLNPSGKLDRQALLALQPERLKPDQPFVPARGEVEEILAAIWAKLLGIERVGIHDNFFELGGDSIKSIQIAAAAGQAGLQLTSRQIFQHQTIAELAGVAGAVSGIQAEQGIVVGAVPLTPIQRWFFEQNLPDAHHWNQAVLLALPERLDPLLLQRAVAALFSHHDALRLRFSQDDNGWKQFSAPPDECTPFEFVDLSQAGKGRAQQIETYTAQAQASLDMKSGPLARAIYFDLGPERPARLFLVVHHLAVDGVSWPILLGDLLAVYEQLAQKQPLELPPKTTSWRQWAIRLNEYAQSTDWRAEAEYWLNVVGQTADLPLDISDLAGNIEANMRVVSTALSAQKTQALRQEAHWAYNTRVNEVLLTALLQTFAGWTGDPALLVDVEGHGREPLFDDVALSRTVGWFTSLFPVQLTPGDSTYPGEMLKHVKELLRAAPNAGIGYGLLRYLHPDRDLANKLRQLPQAQVNFNYLGELAAADLAPESVGPLYSPRAPRRYLIELVGQIIDGRLRLDWYYCQTIHHRETIAQLAQSYQEALIALIEHCLSPDAGDYTPSDFAEANLTQDELDSLLDKFAGFAWQARQED